MKRKLFFLLFLAGLASLEGFGWMKWYHLKRVENVLQAQNVSLKKNNVTLRNEIGHFKDVKYLEHYIREELGYLKGNEVTFELGDQGNP